MARILRTRDDLRIKYRKHKRENLLVKLVFYTLGIALAAYSIAVLFGTEETWLFSLCRRWSDALAEKLNHEHSLIPGLVNIAGQFLLWVVANIGPFIVAFVLLLIGSTDWHKEDLGELKAGIDGESEAKRILARLPDRYIIVPNAHITFQGQHSELDMTVVGDNGVFIIEVKNYSGHITGDIGDHDWQQTKRDRYTKSFYSPVKQVETHVARLAGLLSEAGVDVWVQGFVMMINPRATFDITSLKPSRIGVYNAAIDDGDMLMEDLANTPCKRPLNDAQIERILRCLVPNS